MDQNIQKYKQAVKNLADSESDFIFRNSSDIHANIVISNMLRVSNSEFRIYDDNLSGDIADKDADFYLNLEKFLASGRILKIVVDEVKDKTNRIYMFLKEKKSMYPKNIFLSKSNESFKLNMTKIYEKPINCAIGDSKSFRVEFLTEAKTRKALCSFNSPSVSSVLIKTFDKSFALCEEINLNL